MRMRILMQMLIVLVEKQLSVLKNQTITQNFKRLLAICHVIIFSLTVS